MDLNEQYVKFEGSSPKDIEAAKLLWQSILPFTEASGSLTSYSIQQKLKPANLPGTGSVALNVIGPKAQFFADKKKEHYLTVERKKIEEEEQKLSDLEQIKEDAHALFKKRQEERLMKDMMTKRAGLIEESVVVAMLEPKDDQEEIEEHAKDAMADIDRFEDNLQSRKER